MRGARILRAGALEAASFAPFGDVLEAAGESVAINGGMTARFHDRARVEAVDGRLGISLALGQPYRLPLEVGMLERHPLGSQAWMPLEGRPFLVVVAPDEGGVPGRPVAFVAGPGQGVNYLRGTWHAVLTPLGEAQRFLVVDRIGPGTNLEEHHFEVAWTVAEG